MSYRLSKHFDDLCWLSRKYSACKTTSPRSQNHVIYTHITAVVEAWCLILHDESHLVLMLQFFFGVTSARFWHLCCGKCIIFIHARVHQPLHCFIPHKMLLSSGFGGYNNYSCMLQSSPYIALGESHTQYSFCDSFSQFWNLVRRGLYTRYAKISVDRYNMHMSSNIICIPPKRSDV